MEKLSDLLEMAKVSDIIATKKEKEDFIKAYYLCWKNEQGGIIKSFCESLFAVLFSDQDSIDVNSVIKNKKECAISK